MASTSAVSMAMPLTRVSQIRQPNAEAFLKPAPLRWPSKAAVVVAAKPVGKFQVNATFREKAVTGLTAAALAASMIVPDVAEAASGVSPSLNNFLLSIAAGGVVLTGIIGVVVGVSNFDPVNRA
ncbi:hypothetical protein ABFS83_10G056200 [Erythranthe nasuta]